MATIDEQLAHEMEALSSRLESERNLGRPGFGNEFRELSQQRRFTRSRDLEVVQPQPAEQQPLPSRLSDDPYNVITEMSRLAERLVDARERLATERTRAEYAERELAAMAERFVAARALVHEAQRTAQTAVDRATFLEGRCEGLEDSLHDALHASIFKRWVWRRSLRG
jgi:hypothetical protein